MLVSNTNCLTYQFALVQPSLELLLGVKRCLSFDSRGRKGMNENKKRNLNPNDIALPRGYEILRILAGITYTY
ncbi:hypothetical protein CN689_23985 [Peribacillus butanolivorans]|uniref:Uncharacterized protein n=1 Tax=Peribacillus butanolivorans TaxID=421767 RepID=A0AAX0RW82_9BACI|nr:hypothetical protein CN689_23985 [Peribacillus butanolivorans]